MAPKKSSTLAHELPKDLTLPSIHTYRGYNRSYIDLLMLRERVKSLSCNSFLGVGHLDRRPRGVNAPSAVRVTTRLKHTHIQTLAPHNLERDRPSLQNSVR